MIKTIASMCLSLVSVGVFAQADDVDQLMEVLQRIGSMQGEFRQTQYDESDMLVGESNGNFLLLRPGYYAWEIQSPDSQLIIADPQYIWHHDRDLETVTQRPVDDSEQMSPMQVLGGDEALLRRSYAVEKISDNSYTMSPMGVSPRFKRLSVEFQSADFKTLEIVDNLNQRIVISFDNINSEATLTPDDFVFSAPAGADFFNYEQ
jgi:outer membrane lipoprotein carrier protein